MLHFTQSTTKIRSLSLINCSQKGVLFHLYIDDIVYCDYMSVVQVGGSI